MNIEKVTEDRGKQFHLAKIFTDVDRFLHLGLKAIEAIHYGLWLGILKQTSLHQVTEAGYLAMPMYTNSSYNLQGLFRWEDDAIKKFFDNKHSVLLGAAGGGREIIGLTRLGFRVDAFEASPIYVHSCIELLKNEGIQSEVIVAHPDKVPKSFGVYDGLILGWAAYTHIPGRLARIDFLRQFLCHVYPGSPILISFWERSEEARQLAWIYNIAHFIRRLRNCSEHVELGDCLDERSLFGHCFTEVEVRSELEEAGFQCVFYSKHGYGGHAVGIARELNV